MGYEYPVPADWGDKKYEILPWTPPTIEDESSTQEGEMKWN